MELKQHIELRGGNPPDAVIAGTNLKAYLVARFILGWGIDKAVEQYSTYNLTRSELYAALTFYYDNEATIQEADAQAMEELRAMGARDARDVREEILRRQKK